MLSHDYLPIAWALQLCAVIGALRTAESQFFVDLTDVTTDFSLRT